MVFDEVYVDNSPLVAAECKCPVLMLRLFQFDLIQNAHNFHLLEWVRLNPVNQH